MDQPPEASASRPDTASASPQRPSTTANGDQRATEGVSTIVNDGTGDNWQFMVSTNDTPLNGTNKGRGWRNRQLGGYLKDDSVTKVSADMVQIGLQPRENDSQTTPRSEKLSRDVEYEGEGGSDFGGRHGPGHSLSDENTQSARESTSSVSR